MKFNYGAIVSQFGKILSPSLLCISTLFWVLRTTQSFLKKNFVVVFDSYFYFQVFHLLSSFYLWNTGLETLVENAPIFPPPPLVKIIPLHKIILTPKPHITYPCTNALHHPRTTHASMPCRAQLAHHQIPILTPPNIYALTLHDTAARG